MDTLGEMSVYRNRGPVTETRHALMYMHRPTVGTRAPSLPQSEQQNCLVSGDGGDRGRGPEVDPLDRCLLSAGH